MGRLFPTFRGWREGQSFLALALSQVTLIKNNHYATLAYLGVVCSELYHGEYVTLHGKRAIAKMMKLRVLR